MPATALRHFGQDVARSRALADHARTLPEATPADRLLRTDVLRSAWMLGVGALDAYFCDAYTDVVAATVIAKSRQPAVDIPGWFGEIKFPVRAILEPYANNVNWRWRMAAREMMARENVLSLDAAQRLFNRFFRDGRKWFGDVLDGWILHPDATKRLLATTRGMYGALSAAGKDAARRQARQRLHSRFAGIFQRRHDCIHNCDRPRVAPQPLARAEVVYQVIDDVEFLVRRCDEHINAEFREFLLGLGCTPATVAQAGY